MRLSTDFDPLARDGHPTSALAREVIMVLRGVEHEAVAPAVSCDEDPHATTPPKYPKSTPESGKECVRECVKQATS